MSSAIVGCPSDADALDGLLIRLFGLRRLLCGLFIQGYACDREYGDEMLFILSWTIHDYIGAFAGGIQRDVVTRVYEKLPPIGKVDGKRLVCVLVLENSFSSCHLCVCVLRCPDRLISRQIENRNGPAFCASNRTLVAGRVDAPIVVCNFDCPLFASFELCHEKYFILISPFRTTVCRALLQVFGRCRCRLVGATSFRS